MTFENKKQKQTSCLKKIENWLKVKWQRATM